MKAPFSPPSNHPRLLIPINVPPLKYSHIEKAGDFMRILLADDEVSLAKALVHILEKNNFSVDAVYNGEDALAYLENGCYDAAILDVMMPKLDGIQVLRKIREKSITIPVLMLTAKSEIEDKVEGLDSGANDYLTKPFDTRELLARLRAMTRSAAVSDTKLSCGNITLDRANFTLSSPHGSFRLANKEFQLMELFMSNSQNLLSTDRLMEKIWGYESNSDVNVVWVYISYLRKKLTSLEADVHIKSYRNSGYSLEKIL